MAAKKATKKADKNTEMKVTSAPEGGAASAATPGTSLEENTVFKRNEVMNYADKLRIISGLRQKNPEMFVSVEDLSSPYQLRRPTGIIDLDVAIGGGFPAGGASMLSGPYNSGKSWLLWRMFAMQQRIYGQDFVGAIAHTEGAIDYEWIRRCGCVIAVPDDILNGWDESRHRLRQALLTSTEIDFWKTQVGHLETIQGDTGEQILTGVLSLHEKNVCNIIAVDSVTSLQPQADADKDLDDDAKRAAHASMMKQFWLRYVPHTRRGKNMTTLMMVQQVVANQNKANMPGPMQRYIQDWEVRGGESSKHYKLIDLVVWSGEKLRDNNKQVIGKEVNYRTLKGKAGTHDNIQGEFTFYYHLSGSDMIGDLIASAIKRGLIVNAGTHYSVVNNQTRQPLNDMKYKSDGEIREHMNSDVNFEFTVRMEILAAAGIRCLYR